MNLDVYRNEIPFPRKGDYTTRYWYLAGQAIAKCVGVNGKIEYFIPELTPADLSYFTFEDFIDTETFEAARDVYNAEAKRIHLLFKADLFRDLGIEANPKREKLFSLAWEQGHGCGLSDVYDAASALVQFIEDAHENEVIIVPEAVASDLERLGMGPEQAAYVTNAVVESFLAGEQDAALRLGRALREWSRELATAHLDGCLVWRGNAVAVTAVNELLSNFTALLDRVCPEVAP